MGTAITDGTGDGVIPRLRPWHGWRELAALVPRGEDSVALFENYFAAALGASHAVAFPYGRSALHALRKEPAVFQSSPWTS